MWLWLATTSEISFGDGRVEQNYFDGFEVTRVDSAPRDIRVHLVGSGECGQLLGGSVNRATHR